MYFDEQINRQILLACQNSSQHPNSQIWCDFVSSEVVEGTSRIASVQAFVQSMADLGEKFVFGVADPRAFFATMQFDKAEVTEAATLIRSPTPIYSLYQFARLGGVVRRAEHPE